MKQNELLRFECPRCQHSTMLVGKKVPICGRGHKVTDMTLTTIPEAGTVVVQQEEPNGKSRRKQ